MSLRFKVYLIFWCHSIHSNLKTVTHRMTLHAMPSTISKVVSTSQQLRKFRERFGTSCNDMMDTREKITNVWYSKNFLLLLFSTNMYNIICWFSERWNYNCHYYCLTASPSAVSWIVTSLHGILCCPLACSSIVLYNIILQNLIWNKNRRIYG
jgi:hypothetical protein